MFNLFRAYCWCAVHRRSRDPYRHRYAEMYVSVPTGRVSPATHPPMSGHHTGGSFRDNTELASGFRLVGWLLSLD